MLDKTDYPEKMACSNVFRFTMGVMCVVLVLLSLAQVGEANYKNAPMNGIMFGKRGATGTANGLLWILKYIYYKTNDCNFNIFVICYF